MSKTHELKIRPEFFDALLAGHKHHELRRNDRDFGVGDTLFLKEYVPEAQEYTGRSTEAVVTYITSGDAPCALSDRGLHPDFCILSVEVSAPIVEERIPEGLEKR